MSYENWKDKIGTFEVMDVRGKKMDFFPVLKANVTKSVYRHFSRWP